MKKQALIILVSVGLIGAIIISLIWYYENKLQDADGRLDTATGTVQLMRNQYNESVAERRVFEGDRDALRGEVERWKKDGDSLRSKITGKTKQIALLESELNFKAKGKTKIVRDTVTLPGELVQVRETYQIDTANRFISMSAKVNATDYTLDLKIKELDVEFATESKRNGLFGREYTTVTAVSRNPYVENKDLKSVTISPKRPVLGKGVILVAGVVAGLLIK